MSGNYKRPESIKRVAKNPSNPSAGLGRKQPWPSTSPPAVSGRKAPAGSRTNRGQRERKRGNGLPVLLGLKRAGGIDQHPAGFEQIGCDLQQVHLGLLVLDKILRTPVPADIGLPANDAGARAGGIDQDRVKTIRSTGSVALQVGTNGDHRFTLPKTQQIFPEEPITAAIRLHRYHRTTGGAAFRPDATPCRQARRSHQECAHDPAGCPAAARQAGPLRPEPEKNPHRIRAGS